MNKPLSIVILAAGLGTRMKSSLPKVLHPIGGKPMLQRIIETAQQLQPKTIYVIYGVKTKRVKDDLQHLPVTWVEQKEQLGTGHAVMQALPQLGDEQVLVLTGDTPLITTDILSSLLEQADGRVGVVTAIMPNPAGLGRIVRDDGQVVGIVEHKDCTSEQLAIQEINTGIITAPGKQLKHWLPTLSNHNKQNEYYLTDTIAKAVAERVQVVGVICDDLPAVQGVNDRWQLAILESKFQRRQMEALALQGVTFLDPFHCAVRGVVTIGQDTVVDANVVFEGACKIGANVTIGRNVHLINATIADNVTIHDNTMIEDAIVDSDCSVGPFARLRPGSHLCAGARVGNFVETKKTTLGKGSKANHLTYLGDCEVGENTNIGAGTITCNYDGVNKHKTIIKDDAFIGSNTALVAPVTIEKGVTVAAGSVITNNTEENDLAIARSRQTNIKGWQRPEKS